MNKLAIFAVVAVAVLAAGVGALVLRSQSGGVPLGSPLVHVAVVDYAFSPGSLTIRAGTTVHWMNMDAVGHTVTFGGHDDMGGAMGSEMLGHMGTYEYRFMDPGTYGYHCDPHPYMTAAVVVTA